jgi:uracil phosphoribosyltransferase
MPQTAYPNVRVINHPIIRHLVGELRDETTSVPRFREVVERLGQLLAYEALRDAETRPHRTRTPIEETTVDRLAQRPTLVCILRAGAGLTAGMLRLIPEVAMGHIGMFRDEESLAPVTYYDKLPPSIAEGPVLLCDPMLATGGSAVAGLDLLRDRGCRNVTFVGVIASPEGIARIHGAHPEVPMVLAAIDRGLNAQGFIVPGLGDAGDRTFGTL